MSKQCLQASRAFSVFCIPQCSSSTTVPPLSRLIRSAGQQKPMGLFHHMRLVLTQINVVRQDIPKQSQQED